MSSTSHPSSAGASLSAGGTSSTSRQQRTQAEQTADARKAFLSSLGVASKEIDTDLQSRAKAIHENSAALTKQEKDLQEQTKKLAKENNDTEKWLEKSKTKLAEFDSLDDLGDGLEDGLADLEAILDVMEAKQKNGKYNSKNDRS